MCRTRKPENREDRAFVGRPVAFILIPETILISRLVRALCRGGIPLATSQDAGLAPVELEPKISFRHCENLSTERFRPAAGPNFQPGYPHHTHAGMTARL